MWRFSRKDKETWALGREKGGVSKIPTVHNILGLKLLLWRFAQKIAMVKFKSHLSDVPC